MCGKGQARFCALVQIFALGAVLLCLFLIVFIMPDLPQRVPRPRPLNPYINASYQCTFSADDDYGALNCSSSLESLDSAAVRQAFCETHNPWNGTVRGMDGECVVPCSQGFGLAGNFSSPFNFYNRSGEPFPHLLNFTNGTTLAQFLATYDQVSAEDETTDPYHPPLAVTQTYWNTGNGSVLTDPIYAIDGGQLTAALIAFHINVLAQQVYMTTTYLPVGTSKAADAASCFGNATLASVAFNTLIKATVRFLAADGASPAIIDYYCADLPESCRDLFTGMTAPSTHDAARVAIYQRLTAALNNYNKAFTNCIDYHTLRCFELVLVV